MHNSFEYIIYWVLQRRSFMARIKIPNKTITRQDLREAVYKSVRIISRDEARKIVDETIEEICSTLATGEMVKLRNFGTFKVRNKYQRLGRNPNTGIEAKITPRRVITYKPSPGIISAMNEKPTWSSEYIIDQCSDSSLSLKESKKGASLLENPESNIILHLVLSVI